MDATTIIEARQSKSNSGDVAGDFGVTLVDKLVINDGDELGIRSVFIDTTTTDSAHITIKDDLTMTIKNYCYLSDIGVYNDMEIIRLDDITYTNGTTPYFPTGDIGVASTITAAPQALTKIANMTFMKGSFTTSQKYWGNDFLFEINYTDANGDASQYKIKIPPTPVNQKEYIHEMSIILPTANIPSITLTPSSRYANKQYNIKPVSIADDTIQQSVGAYQVVHPVEFTTTFTLPKGSYSPEDLGAYVTREMTTIDSSTADVTYPGNVLEGSSSLMYMLTNASTTANYFVTATTGAKILKYKQPNTLHKLIGSTQFTLTWDDIIKKFKFEYTHTPYYDSGNNAITTAYKQVANGGTATDYAAFFLNKTGGVLLTDMYAEDSTGAEFDFWEAICGFDLGKLLVKPEHVLVSTHDYPANPVTQPTTNPLTMYSFKITSVDGTQLKPGIQYTENTKTLDQLINKNADYISDVNNVPTSFASSPDRDVDLVLKSTSTQSTSIVANRTFNETLDFAYFLVNIDAKFRSTLVSQTDIRHNIHGIVSRFYVQGSYVSGGEETGFVYRHRGPPLYMDSFRVRILDSDGNVPGAIGNDNSVFLELKRAPPKAK